MVNFSSRKTFIPPQGSTFTMRRGFKHFPLAPLGAVIILFMLGWAFWHSLPREKEPVAAQVLSSETAAFGQSSFAELSDIFLQSNLPNGLLLLRQTWSKNFPSIQDQRFYYLFGRSQSDQVSIFQLHKESAWQMAFSLKSPDRILEMATGLGSVSGFPVYRFGENPPIFLALIPNNFVIFSPSLGSLSDCLLDFQNPPPKSLADLPNFRHLRRLSQGGSFLYFSSLPFVYSENSTLLNNIDSFFEGSGFTWRGKGVKNLRFFLYGKDLVATGPSLSLELIKYLPEKSTFYLEGSSLGNLIGQLLNQRRNQPSLGKALLGNWLDSFKRNFRLDLVDLAKEVEQSEFALDLTEGDEVSGEPASLNFIIKASPSRIKTLTDKVNQGLNDLPIWNKSSQGRVLPDGTASREIVEVPQGAYHWEKKILEGLEVNILKPAWTSGLKFSYAFWQNYAVFSTNPVSVLGWLRRFREQKSSSLGADLSDQFFPALAKNPLLVCWVSGKDLSNFITELNLNFRSSFSWFSALLGRKKYMVSLVPFSLGYEVKIF